MAEWPVEQTREWLMKNLHAKYLEDAQASMRWSEFLEATESHPSGSQIIRESGVLANSGWVEALTQAYGHFFARMTPTGCVVWESFLERRASDPAARFPHPGSDVGGTDETS